MPDGRQHSAQRQEVAREAARLICEEGFHDYRLAKDKAMRRLGMASRGPIPSNLEVDDAVIEHIRLFGEDTAVLLADLRRTALEAMTLLREFSPRLVGDVLRGWVTPFSLIQLHLFAELTEQVDLFLGERHIPFESAEKRFRHPNGETIKVPICLIHAADREVEMALFDYRDLRWSPLSAIDGRPMGRASPAELAELLESASRGAETGDAQRLSIDS